MKADTPKDEKIQQLIQKLEQKYEVMGQDLSSYLDGLLYADYLTYWDYIHLDTLLSLQNPKTGFPDEQIFIIYHQITELYFRLILLEIDQLKDDEQLTEDTYKMRLGRINRYVQNLVQSFDVMVDGMEPRQFLKFRMSLLPASGFQSVQYRLIEVSCADMINLVAETKREEVDSSNYGQMYDNIYWMQGATELATGKKTLTLNQFDQRYRKKIITRSEQMKNSNLWQLFLKIKGGKLEKDLVNMLRELDNLFSTQWSLAHYKSAVRYLQKDPEDIAATGGTNWQKYLPPRFQKVIFFPELWTEEEMQNWGKNWVIKEVFGRNPE